MWLQLIRGGAGALAVGALGKGLDFSTDNQHHEPVTYLGFYGVGSLLVVAVVAITVIIERRKRRSRAAPDQDAAARRAAAHELGLILQSGQGLGQQVFWGKEGWAAIQGWIWQTRIFLSRVFGAAEAQVFGGVALVPTENYDDVVREHVARLEDLVRRLDRVELCADAAGIRTAGRVARGEAEPRPMQPESDAGDDVDALLTQAISLREALMFGRLETLDARQRYLDWWRRASKVIERRAPAHLREWESAGIGVNLGRQASIEDYLALLEAKREALSEIRKELPGAQSARRPTYWRNRQLLTRALKNSYRDGLFWDMENTERGEWGRWAQRTQELIRAALGDEAAHTFDADWTGDSGQVLTGLAARQQRLHDLILEAQNVDNSIELQPGFDGRDWISRR